MKVVKRRITIKGASKSRVFSSNQGWRTIAGRRIYFRSGWEVNYAQYLQFLKEKEQILDWEYEPTVFWFNEIKRGTRSYLPDFKITRLDNTHYWIEVKGYLDAKSKTKIKRFKKYYPHEEIRVVGADWFRECKYKFPIIAENWENKFTIGEKYVD